MTSYLSALRGTSSEAQYDPAKLLNLDPADGRPLQFELDLKRLANDHPDRGWLNPATRSMWRYGPLIWNCPDGDATPASSAGEGWTPLIEDLTHPLASRNGVFVKDEGRPHPGFGANPTGSFKDRGMAMVINQALVRGLKRLVVPTQGNAGDSLAYYGARTGIEVAVIMPEDTPDPIMGNVARLAHQHQHIHLDLVQGTIREAGLRMKADWLPQGYFNCATFQEPGWRIEGKKTLGLEIAEQLGWRLPDAIVYPTGGGTGVLGMYKAFNELMTLGAIASGPLPRFYCVQSTSTAPVVRAFEAGSVDTEAVDPGATLATGLNVPGGVGHGAVLRIIRQTHGAAVAVDEAAIAQALSIHWKRTGLWLCPEGAACYAALENLAESGAINEGETVVLVNTGSFEKYLPALRHLL